MGESSIAAPTDGVLVLTGYGLRVSVERGHLCVEDGVGRSRRSARFARPARELRRLVVIGHSGTISFDALRWLSDIGAGFVHIDSDGKLICTTGPIGLRDAQLRRAQAIAVESGRGLAIAKQLVCEKLAGQLSLLDRLPDGLDAVPVLQAAIEKTASAQTVEALRSIEAEGALAYWKSWGSVEVRFARQHVKRIPDHWLAFGQRRSLITGNPRRATDPANAILNYLYAITEAEARIAALAVGLDPGVGIMHADQRSRDSLACDLMEPVRPVVDRWLLDLLRNHTFSKAQFFETREGACRVLPPVATVLAETANCWAASIGPVAERTARQLAGEEQPEAAPIKRPQKRRPTPLTQANRQAGQDKQRRAKRSTPHARPATLRRNCGICGVELAGRAQQLCGACLAIEYPNPRAEALRANASYDKFATNVPSRSLYLEEISPKVSTAPTVLLMKLTGLSKSSCDLIRRGKLIPHTRHWNRLHEGL